MTHTTSHSSPFSRLTRTTQTAKTAKMCAHRDRMRGRARNRLPRLDFRCECSHGHALENSTRHFRCGPQKIERRSAAHVRGCKANFRRQGCEARWTRSAKKPDTVEHLNGERVALNLQVYQPPNYINSLALQNK